jgi:fructosamine-3-kinase
MQFKKTNQTQYKDALFKEADGLRRLQHKLTSNNIPIKIPQIYSVDETTLVLEHINHMGGSKTQWQQFGQALAQLHLLPEDSCGWHDNNYIGLNPQTNKVTDDWGDFFIKQRLNAQINLIKDSITQEQFKQSVASIEKQLVEFLNTHCPFPSLLHGDLWSGNVLFDEDYAWLIDPAIYCGDAEADLAMTELFGGFPAAFYQAYNAVKPLSEAYALKKITYNLYHQLNHYNLFGSGYLPACEQGFAVINKQFRLNE